MTARRDLILFADRLLDPDAEQELMERLEADPELQALRATITQTPAPELPAAAPQWRMPPPGMSWRTGAMAVESPMVMSSRREVPVGRRFTLRLSTVPDPQRRAVVILRRLPGEDWAVLSPQRPGQHTPLTRLQQTDGAWEINLMASGPPGQQRWAVALPGDDLDIDWTAPPSDRWAPLRAALAAGDVPAATAQVSVCPR
jgi:hypothetical protein